MRRPALKKSRNTVNFRKLCINDARQTNRTDDFFYINNKSLLDKHKMLSPEEYRSGKFASKAKQPCFAGFNSQDSYGEESRSGGSRSLGYGERAPNGFPKDASPFRNR